MKGTVNPARAGMIRISGDGILEWAGKPRASGDDPGQYSDDTDDAA